MIENLVIKPLSHYLADDFFDFFDNRAFSDNAEWSCCYCTYFHMNTDSDREVSAEVKASSSDDALCHALRNRAKNFIAEGTLRGYLAYIGDIPIGFCNTNGKNAYSRRFNEDNTGKDSNIKAVTCFIIAPEYRGQGVATALLERLIEDATAEGYTAIEGYPKVAEASNAENFPGPISLYKKAGFVETANIGDRIVMRKTLVF